VPVGLLQLCLAHGRIGIHHDGGYVSPARVPGADTTLVRLPQSVDSFTAAALGCRFTTAFHGIIDQATVRPGEWVAIFGMGGVGLSAVQIASAIGARVIAVGRSATSPVSTSRFHDSEAVFESPNEMPKARATFSNSFSGNMLDHRSLTAS